MTSEQRTALLAADNKRLQAEIEELKRQVAMWQAEAETITRKYLLATRPDGIIDRRQNERTTNS